MKLSDYVIQFVEARTDSVFLLSGGGIMHLVDSLRQSKKLSSICCHHEQAVATAAEGYSRIGKGLGVALVTTGPGGTNAITGTAGAWLDSIPMLVICGQVKTADITPRKNNIPLVRATGFQELNVLDLVKPISKYAETVIKANDIRYHLEKAVYLAKSGRPGPSWIEIPLDIQAVDIDPKKLQGFISPAPKKYSIPFKKIEKKLSQAKRPLLMVGNGIRLAGGVESMEKFIQKTNINVVSALFTADDLVTQEYPHYLGRQGMWGNETANWALDNCDLLLVIGERLQLTQTSYDHTKFASQAYTIMIDIDKGELKKKILNIDLPIHSDAKQFLDEINKKNIKLNSWDVDLKKIPAENFVGQKKYVNIYRFMDELNKNMKMQSVVSSNAMSATSTHQAINLKKGQRFIVNAGLGQMGQGLPMAIGVCMADGKKQTLCFEGDGSLMLNIQELQTVLHHKLPLVLFILNNGGYYSIRNTQINNFKKDFASSPDSGVTLPHYSKLIPAWGLKYIKINSNKDLPKLKKILQEKGPIVCELMIDPNQPMYPKWTAGDFRNKTL